MGSQTRGVYSTYDTLRMEISRVKHEETRTPEFFTNSKKSERKGPGHEEESFKRGITSDKDQTLISD